MFWVQVASFLRASRKGQTSGWRATEQGRLPAWPYIIRESVWASIMESLWFSHMSLFLVTEAQSWHRKVFTPSEPHLLPGTVLWHHLPSGLLHFQHQIALFLFHLLERLSGRRSEWGTWIRFHKNQGQTTGGSSRSRLMCLNGNVVLFRRHVVRQKAKIFLAQLQQRFIMADAIKWKRRHPNYFPTKGGTRLNACTNQKLDLAQIMICECHVCLLEKSRALFCLQSGWL